MGRPQLVCDVAGLSRVWERAKNSNRLDFHQSTLKRSRRRQTYTGHENTSLFSEMKSIHSYKCLQEVVLVAKQQTPVLDINNFRHDRISYSDIFIPPKCYTPTHPCAANADFSLLLQSVNVPFCTYSGESGDLVGSSGREVAAENWRETKQPG